MVQIVLDNTVKKYIYKKKGESANCRKYILNLLNEPQHLPKKKTPKLLTKFQTKE